MTTVAEKMAQPFGTDHGNFMSATAGNLVEVCGQQAVRVVEEFGKKKFVFADASAITMGGGHWYIGYGDCFCNADHGHHPQCPGSQVVALKVDVASPASTEPTLTPAFSIHIFGQENRTIPHEVGQYTACLEARSLLAKEGRATHACILNQAGVITDAYERVTALSGEVKTKKVDPKKLPENFFAAIDRG